MGQPVALKCEPPAQPVKTGQTSCYDEFGEAISCVGSGQDGEYQYGAARTSVDNGDGTIRDESTGLVWEKIANDGTNHDADIAFRWRFAFTDKIVSLNAAKCAGHDDWRLPTGPNSRLSRTSRSASRPSTPPSGRPVNRVAR